MLVICGHICICYIISIYHIITIAICKGTMLKSQNLCSVQNGIHCPAFSSGKQAGAYTQGCSVIN